jgi:hypothetical protein
MGRVRGLLAVSGAALLVASGCTGDDERVIAASDTAEAEVLAAIEATRATSGRYDMVVEPTGGEDFRGGVRGQFDGPDHRAASWEDPGSLEYDDRTDDDASAEADERSDADPSGDDVPAVTSDELLRVDGRSFLSFDSVAEWAGMLDDPALEDPGFEGPGVEGEPDGSAALPTDAPEIDERIEWLETTDLGSSEEHEFLELLTFGSSLMRPFALLEDLEAIESDGSAELEDGTATRRFAASLPGSALFDAMGFDETLELVPGEALSPDDAEYERRAETVYRYGVEHTRLDVELHVDAQGRLRRTVISVGSDIGAEYQECLALEDFAPALRFSTDYSELGSEVELEVPDAATVISPDAAIALFPDSLTAFDDAAFDEDMQLEEDLAPDPYFDEAGNPVTVSTVHGERVLLAVEDDLMKFGAVIDLDEEDLWEMTPEQIVEAYDRASGVLAPMPRTTTALGELTRVELLWNVQYGMQAMGIDPTVAEGLSDAQLGGLIDAHVAQKGIWGDGVWGDPKVGDVPPEWWEEGFEDDLGSWRVDDDVESFGDAEDFFDGCPGAESSGAESSGAESDAPAEGAEPEGAEA